jgi:hypothetical protein
MEGAIRMRRAVIEEGTLNVQRLTFNVQFEARRWRSIGDPSTSLRPRL